MKKDSHKNGMKRFMLVTISILNEFGLDFVENILSNDHAVFCNKCYVWQ